MTDPTQPGPTTDRLRSEQPKGGDAILPGETFGSSKPNQPLTQGPGSECDRSGAATSPGPQVVWQRRYRFKQGPDRAEWSWSPWIDCDEATAKAFSHDPASEVRTTPPSLPEGAREAGLIEECGEISSGEFGEDLLEIEVGHLRVIIDELLRAKPSEEGE